MILSTFFSHVNNAYRGSDDDAPTDNVDYSLWLNTTNRKLSEWATDSKNVWQSNFSLTGTNEPGTVSTTATTTLTGVSTYFTDYQVGDTVTVSGETVRTIATIVSDTSLTVTVAFANTASTKSYTHQTIIKSGVQTYSVHRSLLNPSDQVFVSTTTNPTQDLRYTVGKPQERSRFDNEIYFSDRDPQLITFYDTIDSSSNLVGGTLKIPGYYVPNDLVNATDVVPVDDPYWLVMAVASELAFNDITYSDKAPDLNSKANNLYSQMVMRNRRGTNKYPRIAQTNVDRIPGPRNENGSDITGWDD